MNPIKSLFPAQLSKDIERQHFASSYSGKLRHLKFQNPFSVKVWERQLRLLMRSIDPRGALILSPGGEVGLHQLAWDALTAQRVTPRGNLNLGQTSNTAGSAFARDLARSSIGSLLILNPEQMNDGEWRWYITMSQTLSLCSKPPHPSILFISALDASVIFNKPRISLRPAPSCQCVVKPEFSKSEAEKFIKLNIPPAKTLPSSLNPDSSELLRGKTFPIAIAELIESVTAKQRAIEDQILFDILYKLPPYSMFSGICMQET